jgi:hypothetical protein
MGYPRRIRDPGAFDPPWKKRQGERSFRRLIIAKIIPSLAILKIKNNYKNIQETIQ